MYIHIYINTYLHVYETAQAHFTHSMASMKPMTIDPICAQVTDCSSTTISIHSQLDVVVIVTEI